MDNPTDELINYYRKALKKKGINRKKITRLIRNLQRSNDVSYYQRKRNLNRAQTVDFNVNPQKRPATLMKSKMKNYPSAFYVPITKPTPVLNPISDAAKTMSTVTMLNSFSPAANKAAWWSAFSKNTGIPINDFVKQVQNATGVTVDLNSLNNFVKGTYSIPHVTSYDQRMWSYIRNQIFSNELIGDINSLPEAGKNAAGNNNQSRSKRQINSEIGFPIEEQDQMLGAYKNKFKNDEDELQFNNNYGIDDDIDDDDEDAKMEQMTGGDHDYNVPFDPDYTQNKNVPLPHVETTPLVINIVTDETLKKIYPMARSPEQRKIAYEFDLKNGTMIENRIITDSKLNPLQELMKEVEEAELKDEIDDDDDVIHDLFTPKGYNYDDPNDPMNDPNLEIRRKQYESNQAWKNMNQSLPDIQQKPKIIDDDIPTNLPQNPYNNTDNNGPDTGPSSNLKKRKATVYDQTHAEEIIQAIMTGNAPLNLERQLMLLAFQTVDNPEYAYYQIQKWVGGDATKYNTTMKMLNPYIKQVEEIKQGQIDEYRKSFGHDPHPSWIFPTPNF